MDSLIGAWRLLSFEFRNKDGQVRYPFGEDAVGYIIYSEDGYLAITIMSAFFSYCGRYEVRGDRVIHHLEVSLFPNWIGVDLERIFELEDNRLILSAPLLWSGVEQSARTIWERV
jgi:hypothetical protein